ncbi:hypothetical protein TanjilG_00149 [Lupinus angustifolius]|uniref:GATA transcription factor n=1 Tax=Lupinus angustifolius TaxID=3871 RepID=A0A394D209_LUPAN|nr:PREDICTED: GATA transcription factor 9-like [Lupinus angustifolius]OIW17009.1 hypothetical protein TanjilG_00149 [Lupinus angustifolius]
MEYFVGGYFGAGANQYSPEHRYGEPKSGVPFAVDDLLDFSNADAIMSDGFFDNVVGNSNDSSTVAGTVDSGNSIVSGTIVPCAFAGGDSQFSGGELCVPYDDMVELEWLSNFVEDSFSTEEDLKTLQLLSGGAVITSATTKPHTPDSSSSSDIDTTRNTQFLHAETPLPGKARSKRSRAAPGDWSKRLVHLVTPPKTKEEESLNLNTNNNNNSVECSGRKCLHCGADKTPQWRTGPMGPKTLCNACGVRFKSGRLVPEYRPAASPTFVSTKHSNSHRKVMELRRQKDVQRHHHHHHQHQELINQTSIFDVSNGGDDYLIHGNHIGQEFRHVM